MIDHKEFPAIKIVIGCAVVFDVAGQHLEFAPAPAKQTLALAISSSTTSTTAVMFNTTTFAKVDPPPPLVPPGDRQWQG
jgi:hypothetical protein